MMKSLISDQIKSPNPEDPDIVGLAPTPRLDPSDAVVDKMMDEMYHIVEEHPEFIVVYPIPSMHEKATKDVLDFLWNNAGVAYTYSLNAKKKCMLFSVLTCSPLNNLRFTSR
ncbi:unnamed protein product [Anisakis simplex]|uniref:GTP cyclohydrolase 1 n=1 Tax=Anisakis simplex TaxID=6269 RepID=A0A0M3JDT0_ANISI|nr:unnamed protein product [Anisakis simplex]